MSSAPMSFNSCFIVAELLKDIHNSPQSVDSFLLAETIIIISIIQMFTKVLLSSFNNLTFLYQDTSIFIYVRLTFYGTNPLRDSVSFW